MSGDYVFRDGKRRCPKCAAMYFHGALDRMEEQTTSPTDESRASSSTATEVSCDVCDGAGEGDNGNPCGRCSGTGTVRTARVDHHPTIAPSTHVLCTVCATVVPRKEAKQIGQRYYCRACDPGKE